MRTRYSAFMTRRLEELCQEAAEHERGRKDLSDEVDLARVMAGQAIALYEKAVIKGEDGEGNPVPMNTKIAVQRAMQDALKFVSDLVVNMAKVDDMNQGVLPFTQVRELIGLVQHAVEETFVDHPELLEKFQRRLGTMRFNSVVWRENQEAPYDRKLLRIS